MMGAAIRLLMFCALVLGLAGLFMAFALLGFLSYVAIVEWVTR